MNLAVISSKNSLETTTEGVTHIDDVVLAHLLPLSLNRGLQVGNAVVAHSAGLGLHLPPDAVVQWVQVRALWRPEVLGPKIHVFGHPILHTGSRV